jgi:hypothetical protein
VSTDKCPRCGAARHTADYIPSNAREYLCKSRKDNWGFVQSEKCELNQLRQLAHKYETVVSAIRSHIQLRESVGLAIDVKLVKKALAGLEAK